ncbi:Coiled-coil domain-containing protein 43 [Sergentomyia squamirostris]
MEIEDEKKLEVFNEWVNKKLKEINIDESVFGPYIFTIVTSAPNLDHSDEIVEEIEELLTGMIDNGKPTAEEIVNKLKEILQEEPKEKESAAEDVDARLARLLESNVVTSTVQRRQTSEESQIRSKILAQYSQVPLSDEEDEGGASSTFNGDAELGRNTNVETVQKQMKERREQARLESQKKKEKDKEDLKKQKQLREEKKEKRKTVKQERRR